MDSLAIRFIPWPRFYCLALLLSPLDFRSFDPRRVILDASNLGLHCFAFPRWREISASIAIFFVACDCLKCLVLKGLA